MPKPRIAVLNQGKPSLSLAKLTGLPLIDVPEHLDYLLGYAELNTPLVQTPLDIPMAELAFPYEPFRRGETSFAQEPGTEQSTPTFAPVYLQLQPTDKTQGAIVVDGLEGTLGFRRHPARLLHEPLIRAIGANTRYQPSVVDATAGWGTDAFLLASFGCHMQLIEADPLVSALLADGLRRWHQVQQNNIGLSIGHAVELIPTLTTPDFPEVIYLDPMFPARQKTAAVKKNMAFLQQWLGKIVDIDDEIRLLDTARHYAKKRVVVKRPQSAPYLAGIKPSGAITTRHHRYDIYASL